MSERFSVIFPLVMKEEGGFVNNPSDPGGMTNHGVTKHVWDGWVGRSVDEQAMRRLSLVDVEPLYKKKYWGVCRCEDLPAGVDLVVFDCAVNSGTTKASRLLQQVLSTTIDGVIGPNTVAKACKEDPKKIIVWYCDARLAFLQSLGTFKVFGKGWTARVSRIKAEALKLA